jgi:hypothetical protein
VVPNVSEAAGTAAQVRVADSCRRFRIGRAAQSTALHRDVRAADGRAVQCSWQRWLGRATRRRRCTEESGGGAAAGEGRGERCWETQEVRVKVQMAGGRPSVAVQGSPRVPREESRAGTAALLPTESTTSIRTRLHRRGRRGMARLRRRGWHDSGGD